MIAVVLMGIATIAVLIFLIESGKAGRVAAAEVVLSRAWSYRFARQALQEKKDAWMEDFLKYHTTSEKKATKKVREWDKQIEAYRKSEEIYLSGHKFFVLDMVTLFGYQLLVDLKLDGDSDLLRKLILSCEKSGYVELERNQETSGKKNSSIYAYYLLASLFAFLFVGVITGCFLAVAMIAIGNEFASIVMMGAVGLVGPALYGYLPYDELHAKAKKRQEEIDQSFPNVVSKITLLVMAGMNISNAIGEAAASDNTLMCRELRIAVSEMNKAASMQEALTRLQCRCNNKYLDKMVTIIAKSYVEGNTRLASDLKVINDECWLDKKHNARRMGEAVQNRLFIPTMLMFIGILVVIVVPAMSGFNL